MNWPTQSKLLSLGTNSQPPANFCALKIRRFSQYVPIAQQVVDSLEVVISLGTHFQIGNKYADAAAVVRLESEFFVESSQWRRWSSDRGSVERQLVNIAAMATGLKSRACLQSIWQTRRPCSISSKPRLAALRPNIEKLRPNLENRLTVAG